MSKMEVSQKQKSHNLERFVDAQERMYEIALAEVKSGKKVSHWIWYIFPQLKGLGMSGNSHYYGIDDINEARAYLEHPILGTRLREITSVYLKISGKNTFGYLDAMKVRSCMTLFNEVSEDDLFKKVIDRYYRGCFDEKTLTILGKLYIKFFMWCCCRRYYWLCLRMECNQKDRFLSLHTLF